MVPHPKLEGTPGLFAPRINYFGGLEKGPLEGGKWRPVEDEKLKGIVAHATTR